mgnify:CR=1 FL=1|jgi:two-component system alkaline phosphatase synthesis response regulator PhoP
MRPLIFSVEDDENIARVIQLAIQNSGYDVRIFEKGSEFLEAITQTLPDVILLDIMLPEMDGLTILKQIKSHKAYQTIPVMIISARSSEVDKVIGLDLGADDYLQKPFGVLELISRIKALIRRTQKQPESNQIVGQGFTLNLNEHTIQNESQTIELTVKEFAILKLLMQSNNSTVTREEIFQQVWGYDFVGETRTLDVHMKEVRQKLSHLGINPNVIQTIRGVGYKFVL